MRNNYRDNFEKVYLRYNIIQRAIKMLSQEKVDEILAKPLFIRCTTYIARRTFRKNMNFLCDHGFWQEDLESISKIFGLSFYLYGTEFKSEKDESMLLMRYIGHRFQRFVEWATKKFGRDDKVYESVGIERAIDGTNYAKSYVPDDEDDSLIDKITFATEDSDQIEAQVTELRARIKAQGKNAVLTHTKSVLNRKAKIIKKDLMVMRRTHREQRAASKQLTEALKSKLDTEWYQYKDQLVHYATSKHVAYDIRKKAQDYCRKYGIIETNASKD